LGDVTVPSLEGALNLLVGEVDRCALDADPEHLHLHAALATNRGRAVILAATANTGKSTTVAQLAAGGWGLVTDETVRLSPATAEVTGFPKPALIEPGDHKLVPHLEDWMIPPLGDGADDFRFLPIGANGVDAVNGGIPRLVVLLSRPAVGTPATVPAPRAIHPADAVVALMQETLDAERFGTAAVQLLATLAGASHCFELTLGAPSETAEQIEKLFQLEPVGFDVAPLPPSSGFSPGVVSVTIGDRVVVHEQGSGRIFALDAGGARVWRQLGGWNGGGEIDVDGPVIAPFVAQLRSLGVLAGAR
jgi:hypothetical protein